MHTLHVIATPIGNLQDVSLRTLELLGSVGVIAAEDTRVTRRLLSRHGISNRMVSYHEHSPPSRLDGLLAVLEDADVALVSDAGTPGVNDAGRELVRAAAEAGANVVAVPGPSSVTSAVSVSGLDVNGFVFLGFLPRKTGDRRRVLAERAGERLALVTLESPRRLRSTLADMLEVLGDRRLAVCRELTKLHEEVFRGDISAALEHFAEPRGEFTIVVDGADEKRVDPIEAAARAREMLTRLRADGVTGRSAVADVVDATGLPKRDVYDLWIRG